MLDPGQLDEFVERGFLVLRRAVPPDVVDAASCIIDELIERQPPGPQVRGPYNYFPEAARVPALAVRRAAYFRIKRAGHRFPLARVPAGPLAGLRRDKDQGIGRPAIALHPRRRYRRRSRGRAARRSLCEQFG